MRLLEEVKNIAQVPLPTRYLEMTQDELRARVKEIKEKFGSRLFIPGHHYQKDEIIEFCDATGDSLQLAHESKKQTEAEYIIFCGVHFMAETADILTSDAQKVILPDMRAGCSMADMADIYQTEKAWKEIVSLLDDDVLPITYVNSTAAIKAFVGKHGGTTVTSSNAKSVIQWAFTQKKRILFLPDQHLGRNTCYDIGIPLEEMAIWDPIKGELIREDETKDVKVILWKGHCSVHENFRMNHIDYIRKTNPDMRIIVHPECTFDVVQAADDAGSTKYIIDTIHAAPSGSQWAIGTESNLVNRIIQEHQDKKIVSLNPYMCPCLTMNRIDLPHLVWTLEQIENGNDVNIISVDKETAQYATKALEKMLSIS